MLCQNNTKHALELSKGMYSLNVEMEDLLHLYF